MKTSKRFLSLFLAVIMVVSLMASGVSATTGDASGSDVIMSESFESWAGVTTEITSVYSVLGGTTSWNGATAAEGWAISAQNGKVLVQPALGGAQDGNVSIKLTPDATNTGSMNRAKLQYRIPQSVYDKMEHGAEYTFTVYFKGTAPKGNYEVKTYVPGIAAWPNNDVVVSNEWAKTEYVFTLDKETPNPASGVTTLDIFIGIPWHVAGTYTGELYIDNVSIVKTKDAPKPEPEVDPDAIYAETFEDLAELESATSIPVGTLVHEPYWGGGAGAIDATDSHTGTKSVKLTPSEHSNTATWITSDYAIGRTAIRIDAAEFEVGATYKASAWFKADKAGSKANINVQANPYTVLNNDQSWTNVGTEWVLKEVEFVMPEGVQGNMLFRFGASSYTAADAYMLVDDISIVKTQDAPQPDDGSEEDYSDALMFESFEDCTNALPNSKWGTYIPNGEVTIAPSTERAKDGSVSIKLTPKDTTQQNRGAITYKMTAADYAAMEDGATYEVSVYMYSDGAGYQGRWEVKDKDSGWLSENIALTNGQWVKKTYTFTLDKTLRTKPFELVIGMAWHDAAQSTGNLYIDNVCIKRIPWVNEITLSHSDTYMEVGSTLDLTYELDPAGEESAVSFTSSDPSVAEVDANGRITAKKAGTATITAVTAISAAVAKCTIRVVDNYVALEGLSLNKTTLNITPGWQEKLTVTFNPADATDKDVIWTSSNESVVKVDGNGNITAMGVGAATVTVKAPVSGKAATCAVTVAEDASFPSTSRDITVDFGKSQTVDLSQILAGEYTVLTKSFKGKVEIIGDTLKYTSYTWLMEKDGFGFTDAVYTDTVKVAVQDGDKAAIITLNVTINKLEKLFYDENGNWITDVDLMFTEEYLDAIKADLRNNPNGDRAKVFDYMLDRVDVFLNANTPAYEGRPWNSTTEYDADLRYVADVTVNFLMAYLLTEDLPGFETQNEVYLQKTIQWAEAGLAYPYWGATHYSLGYGWRNADLAAGQFLFSTAMVYHWLKNELINETCTYVIGQDGTMNTVVTTPNMPTLEALEHRLWYVCDEMYNQTYTFDTYCGNHMHVRLGGLTAATIALRGDAETQAEKDLLVKYTGLIMYKDGLGMYSLMPDGTSQEGVPYWEYAAEWLIKAGVIIRDNFDIDLFETTRVFEHSGDYILYNQLPSGSGNDSNCILNIGDSPTEHWYGPGNILRFIAYQYGDANAQWLAGEIEDSGFENGYSQWMNVMFFDDDVEPEAPTPDHTLHWFQDMDHIIARSDWSGNEDLLSFKCGIPFGKNLMQLQKDGVYNGRADAGHAHTDANHITLYANGEFLLRDDGYCDKYAGNHNTLLVDGMGQLGEFADGNYVDFLNEWVYFEQDAEPFMKLAVSNSAYDYMVGNATEAYSKDLNLDLFERNVLWLKDEKVLLVVDNIKTSVVTDLELRWFPQSKNVGPSGDVYIIQSDKNTMNFYPMTEEATTEFLDVLKVEQYSVGTEKAFRQTYTGTDWQNAVAFAWNDAGSEVAPVQYQEGENANEHQFGVNGKIYTINVATNEVTVTEGNLDNT